MMGSKNTRVITLFIAIFLLAAMFKPGVSSSQTYGESVCANIFSPAFGQQPYSVFNHISSLNGMLGISLFIILIMLTITGLLYGIGYAFKIDKLIRFSKTEIGEIILTVLIVFIFLGTFDLANGITSSSITAPVTGTHIFSNSLFQSACGKLADSSISLISPLLGVLANNLFYQFVQSLSISIEPNHFGISFAPLAGIGLQVYLLGIVYNLTWMLIMVMLGLAIFLYIIYSIFPLFLFFGITLRTIPWTRAAGGAFLGMFIGFFILLPIMLNYMLMIPSSQITSVTTASISSDLSGGLSTINSQGAQLLTPSISGQLITGTTGINDLLSILETVIFSVVSAVISIIITIDFSETLGDFLGAPSLATSNTLKKLI